MPSAWANGILRDQGHANLTIDGGLQDIYFSAIEHRNGSVSGHLTLNSRAQDVIIQGDVTCLVINGKGRLGGIITDVTRNSDLSCSTSGAAVRAPRAGQWRRSQDPVDLVSDATILDCSSGPFLKFVAHRGWQHQRESIATSALVAPGCPGANRLPMSTGRHSYVRAPHCVSTGAPFRLTRLPT